MASHFRRIPYAQCSPICPCDPPPPICSFHNFFVDARSKFTGANVKKKLNLIIQTFDNQKSKKSVRRRHAPTSPPFFLARQLSLFRAVFPSSPNRYLGQQSLLELLHTDKPVNAESCPPKLKFCQTENISYPGGNELAKMPQLCRRSSPSSASACHPTIFGRNFAGKPTIYFDRFWLGWKSGKLLSICWASHNHG